MSDVKIEVELLDDRILVEPEPAPAVTAGGVVLPDSARDDVGESHMRVGRVMAAGPGRWIDEPGIRAELAGNVGVWDSFDRRQPIDVEVGDRVIYHKNRGDKIFLNGGSFLLMGNRDICVVIGDDTEVSRLVVRA